MKLSEHFSLEEMVDSQIAARLGLDNTPTPEILERLTQLCATILEPAHQVLGPMYISSGYRSAAVNAVTPGSATHSAHVLGDAADVIPLHATKLALAKWVAMSVPFDQVILEYGEPGNPAWIHVACGPGQRGEVLRILHGTGYEPVTL